MRRRIKHLLYIVLVTIAVVLFLLLFSRRVEAEEFKGKYYEKDGCIYLRGELTKEEKLAEREHYKARITKREAQVNAEAQRSHEIKIENIKAGAMRDYLIAQGMPLREVADAMRNLKIRQNVNVGNVTSSVGDITNTSSSTSEGGNATATGTGGTSSAL